MLISDRPGKPVIERAVNITSSSLVLIWLEPHHNNAPILGFHVMYNEKGNNTIVLLLESVDKMLHIPELLPGVTYQFTVVAFNDIGESDLSDAYNVTTLEEGK